MNTTSTRVSTLLLTTVLSLAGTTPIAAQTAAPINPDGSLPSPSRVTVEGDRLTIEGGTEAGNNLFHSFDRFSIPSNTEAIFNHRPDLANIITRVTGGDLSRIDGVLQTQGSANFYLLNPNGIVFGENARLEVGGSFLATTGDRLLFEDGLAFPATAETPLLSVNVPTGVQMGANPGEIRVLGSGHAIALDLGDSDLGIPSELQKGDRPLGLQVPPGETLALLAANITLDGGNLTAPDGQVELWAVSGTAVSFGENFGANLDLSSPVLENANLGDIRLQNAASVELSGNGGGGANLVGARLHVGDSSLLLSDSLGDGTGTPLVLYGTQAIAVIGAADPTLPSGIWREVAPNATGGGGDVVLDSAAIAFREGGNILTRTLGAGDAGNVFLRASDIELVGTSSDAIVPSGIPIDTEGAATGNGGTLGIETRRLSIRDGAAAIVITSTRGDGGDAIVRATEAIEILGSDAEFLPSQISNFSLAGVGEPSGNAGNITIETGRLSLREGGSILSQAEGSGNTSAITIRADEVEILGTTLNFAFPSTIASDALEGTGRAGNISVDARYLSVRDGAVISSSTLDAGDGATISIRAETIEVLGTDAEFFPSAISAEADLESSGNGGRVEIESDRLLIRGGAVVSSQTAGSGRGGDVVVRVRDIDIAGTTPDGTGVSGIGSDVFPGATGDGGTVLVEAEMLRLRDSGSITANTFGTGDAGSLTVRAEDIDIAGDDPLAPESPPEIAAASTELDPVSQEFFREELGIDVTSGTGDAGTLRVEAERLRVSEGGGISVRSDLAGNAGNLEVEVRRLELDGGQLSANSVEGDGGNIAVNADTLLLRQGGSIRTNATDTARGGNIHLNTDVLAAFDDSDITANATDNFAGRVEVTTQGLFGIEFRDRLTPNSDITATSELGSDFQGVVAISTPNVDTTDSVLRVTDAPVSVSQLIADNCAAVRAGSSFIYVGRGGTPPAPTDPLSGLGLWRDFRPLVPGDRHRSNRSARAIPEPRRPTFQEAVTWRSDEAGRVQLLAGNGARRSLGDRGQCAPRPSRSTIFR